MLIVRMKSTSRSIEPPWGELCKGGGVRASNVFVFVNLDFSRSGQNVHQHVFMLTDFVTRFSILPRALSGDLGDLASPAPVGRAG